MKGKKAAVFDNVPIFVGWADNIMSENMTMLLAMWRKATGGFYGVLSLVYTEMGRHY